MCTHAARTKSLGKTARSNINDAATENKAITRYILHFVSTCWSPSVSHRRHFELHYQRQSREQMAPNGAHWEPGSGRRRRRKVPCVPH